MLYTYIYTLFMVLFAVMLQPSADLSSVDKSKHKFMVQSMYAPPNFVNDNLDQVVGNAATAHRTPALT